MAKLITIRFYNAEQPKTLHWDNGEESIVKDEDEMVKVITFQRSRGLQLISITGPETQVYDTEPLF